MPDDNSNALIARYIENGSNAHYALLFTPTEQRDRASAVMSFAGQMRGLVAIGRDVAPAKIHWWHEELARLTNGAARHPITKALEAYSSEPLHSALNELLHGAVMDFNAVDVTATQLDDYLHRRCGALLAALSAVAGTPASVQSLRAPAASIGISQILFEARDPRFATLPAAQLSASDAVQADQEPDNTQLESWLRNEYEQQLSSSTGDACSSVTGAVYLALYKKDWPRIIASPYGELAKLSSPLSKLFTAWRSARRFT